MVRRASAESVDAKAPVRGAALPGDACERVVSRVGQSHQIDDLIVTRWDTTRCVAASGVAIASLAGRRYLEGLAAHVVRNLESRIAALWDVVGQLDEPQQREQGRAKLLPELQRHINAFGLSLATALTELGYARAAQPGVGVGAPAHLGDAPFLVSDGAEPLAVASPDATSTKLTIGIAAPDSASRQWFVRDGVTPRSVSRIAVPVVRHSVPWARIAEGDAAVAVQSKDLELAGAAQVLAAYQLTGEELKLLERMLGCLEAELVKARKVLETIHGAREIPSSEVLQLLGDLVLLAQQHSGFGLNAAESGEALAAAGLMVSTTGKAVPWRDQANAVAPGEFLYLEGRGHSVTFGRLRDGRTFLYDSEGVLGDRAATCLRFVAPGQDATIDQHYGAFQATHRYRAPRARDVFAKRAGYGVPVPTAPPGS